MTRFLPYHRWVAQQMLGRDLLPGEVVHHRNGDHYDNRPENLEVLSSHAEHRRCHRRLVDTGLAARLLDARTHWGYSREWVTRNSLLDPPISSKTLERWEKGLFAVPKWRANQLFSIYEVAA